jgi:hypothetical protein
MTEQDGFGPALRRERERSGLDLHTIATATKISASLLDALERNDLSRWPGGIFRRSFVRSYAAAIGLPPDETVAEFVRLFPEEPDPLFAAAQRGPKDGPVERAVPLRLEMAPEGWTSRFCNISIATLATALVEVLLIAAVGVMAWSAGLNAWIATTLVAVAYQAAGTAAFGGSVLHRLARRVVRPRTSAGAQQPSAHDHSAEPEPLAGF